MADSMDEIMHPRGDQPSDPDFPHAPYDWSKAAAEQTAAQEGLDLNESHWELIRALQEYFAKHEQPNIRELRDALDEKFHIQGGMRYLYGLLPAGPVAQGCRLAGITAPPGLVDKGFGSVV